MPCFICYQAAMDSSTPSTAGSPCRDRTGRFASGNRIGKGNPFARRTAEFHSALLDAVEPRMVEALAKRMMKAALEGDVAAAKLVLDRVLGRGAPSVFKMPRISSAADLPVALNQILRAATRGDITSEDAARYASIVDVAGRAIAAAEIEECLQRLETGAGIGPRKLA